MDDCIQRLGPSSSVMPFSEAKYIVANFGDRVVALGEFKVKHLGQEPVPLSLPVESLKYSKWQIQIALAVAVAEFVVQSAVELSDQTSHLLWSIAASSGELAWFTREPAFVPIRESDSPLGLFQYDQSQWIYLEWQKTCERCLIGIVGETTEPDNVANRPSERALVKYWQTIDRLIPDLLSDPVLTAIRET